LLSEGTHFTWSTVERGKLWMLQDSRKKELIYLVQELLSTVGEEESKPWVDQQLRHETQQRVFWQNMTNGNSGLQVGFPKKITDND
jgi:hypothetical protein